MAAEQNSDPVVPPLPVRASIYIAPDGTVHFGALFADLVPVAAALGRAAVPPNAVTATRESSNDAATTSSAISPPISPR